MHIFIITVQAKQIITPSSNNFSEGKKDTCIKMWPVDLFVIGKK